MVFLTTPRALSAGVGDTGRSIGGGDGSGVDAGSGLISASVTASDGGDGVVSCNGAGADADRDDVSSTKTTFGFERGLKVSMRARMSGGGWVSAPAEGGDGVHGKAGRGDSIGVDGGNCGVADRVGACSLRSCGGNG